MLLVDFGASRPLRLVGSVSSRGDSSIRPVKPGMAKPVSAPNCPECGGTGRKKNDGSASWDLLALASVTSVTGPRDRAKLALTFPVEMEVGKLSSSFGAAYALPNARRLVPHQITDGVYASGSHLRQLPECADTELCGADLAQHILRYRICARAGNPDRGPAWRRSAQAPPRPYAAARLRVHPA
jgi:hypothetical protein